jgi:hypothetical protein
MIDYDKLRKAHKLYPYGYLKIIPIFDPLGSDLIEFNYSMEIQGCVGEYFCNLDDLIAKLEELTQPTNPFEPSEEWEAIGHLGEVSLSSGEYLIRENIVYARKKEPTTPKPKYEVGQEVYWTFNNIIYDGVVYHVSFDLSRYQINSYSNYINLHAEQIYPSREALIRAQIEYWHGLLADMKMGE